MSRSSLPPGKRRRFSKIYPFRSVMAGLILGIWSDELKVKWSISIFLHLPDGNTCRHGGSYIRFSIFPRVPYSFGNPVMLLPKRQPKSIWTAPCMNGKEKSGAVLSVYCLKWRIPDVFNENGFFPRKYNALRILWKHSASSILHLTFLQTRNFGKKTIALYDYAFRSFIEVTGVSDINGLGEQQYLQVQSMLSFCQNGFAWTAGELFFRSYGRSRHICMQPGLSLRIFQEWSWLPHIKTHI